jgi:sulfur carrier protein
MMDSSTHAGTIELSLDGKPHRVAVGLTLAALVDQLGHRPEGVGTAVNGVFVARSARSERVLAPGDAVMLFQPIVGG